MPNVLSTHPNLDTDFILLSEPLFAYIVWIFLSFLTYPVALPYLLSCRNEDTIFDPGISIYHSFMPDVSHRSGTFTILCLDQHAHTLHHLESLLTTFLDNLDILKEDLFEHEHVGFTAALVILVIGTSQSRQHGNLKKRNDDFNGNDGENAYEHINKFLEIVGSIKINGLTQDRFRLSIFPVALAGATYEWFTKECIGSITTWDNMLEKFILKFHHLSDHNEKETEEDDNPNEMDNVPEIFRIEGNLFDFETPLCEAYHEFSRLLKIDIDLFTYDIQNIKTYDEYKQELNDDEVKGTEKSWSENGVPYQLCDHICEPYRFKNGGTKWPTCTSDIDGFYNGGKLSGMVRVGSMTYFQDHKWYDELADGTLKDETLALKAKIEGSWGDATLGVVKFCKWLKRCFENFHELEYEVLVKLQECWWKVNAHEIASFTRMENFRRGL
ncbi:hypothetical protein Tco_1305127, partial [Tanacetum coccineum]